MELKNVKRGRIKDYVKKFKSGSYVDGKTPWNVKCDIALPCATQNELGGADAQLLAANGCIAVAEGANMPCTPEAVEMMHKTHFDFPGLVKRWINVCMES